MPPELVYGADSVLGLVSAWGEGERKERNRWARSGSVGLFL